MEKTTNDPINQIRRKDRAQSDPWVREFLHRAAYGAIATCRDGQPFLNTNLFVYDEDAHAIYFHSSPHGRTRANIAQDGRVCFSASRMGRLLPADTALEFSVEYASVVVFGKAVIVEDGSEAEHGLQLLLDKYFPHLRPGVDYRPVQPPELARTTVYRIDIESWSGKQKQAIDDFPGAFLR